MEMLNTFLKVLHDKLLFMEGPKLRSRLTFRLQKAILVASYNLHFFLRRGKEADGWVIGVSEICGLIHQMGQLVNRGITICFTQDPFSPNLEYQYKMRTGKFWKYRRVVLGPYWLGSVLNQAEGFIYLSLDRFLLGTIDNGDYEFNFIRSKGKKLVVWFTGSDIRSIVRMRQNKVGAFGEDWSDVMPYLYPYVLTKEYDDLKMAIATVANRYANGIFNNDSDQVSYLSNVTHDTWPIIDKAFFNLESTKFDDLHSKEIVILHVPSNPVLKGTLLVNAAIKRLINEGYSFTYVELRNVSREVVNTRLRTAHIVLNQFYAKIPGHFGYEAMANCCVVLQSAIIEEKFGILEPWVMTNTYQIYDNLKALLDDFSRCKIIAEQGYQYAIRAAHPDALGPQINEVLRSIG